MSRTFRAGLVVFGLLSVADLSTPLVTDGEHPPMSIAIVAAVIGLISLGLVVLAWRGVRRAVVPLVVLRVLSALTAVPAFLEPGVPGAAKAAAGAGIVVTAVALILVLVPARQQTTVDAR